MRAMRFSHVVLSLVLVLLITTSTLILIPAFQGAKQALQHEIHLTYKHDQRALNSILTAHFDNLQQTSHELSNSNELHKAIINKNPNAITQTIDHLLAVNEGKYIDAIVLESSEKVSTVVTNASMLNLNLPLAELSKEFKTFNSWTSLKTEHDGQHFELLHLGTPVISTDSGEVIGKQHTYILINDSFWIINKLQELFGSSAIFISKDKVILDQMESSTGLLKKIINTKNLTNNILTSDKDIIREHFFQIDKSDNYSIKSIITNTAHISLIETYRRNLYFAIFWVAILGLITIFAIRYLIITSLRQLTQYAEHIPESGSPRPFTGGQFNEFIRVGHAIEKMLNRIREYDKRLSSIIDNSPDLIFIKDNENKYTLVNKEMAKLMDLQPDQIIGNPDSDFWSDEKISKVRHWDEQVLEYLNPVQYELPINVDNKRRTYLFSKFPIIDDNNQAYAIGGIARDITIEKKSEELIWRHANFDLLTDLPNRRLFIDRIKQDIKKNISGTTKSAVLFINIDHFKEINDSKGREAGDTLIKMIATRMRDPDIKFSSLSRIGGDEFAIYLSKITHFSEAEDYTKLIFKKFSSPFKVDGDFIYLTVSIGIAFYPSDANDHELLIQHANQAMYIAKEQGRNRRHYFTEAVQDSIQTKVDLVHDLRTALAENQLSVFYQPIVSLSDNSIHKAEALIRWQHPTKGFISPEDFIPVAEESGMIIEIGNWVFSEAVKQVRQWRKLFQEDFQISVNKSPVQFRNEDNYIYEWFDCLHKNGLPGNAIVIEMTEGLLMDLTPLVSNKLFLLSDTGMEIALDDFGTGYSSLAYLKKFDIDFLKIDRSFVTNIEHSQEESALCESIIIMAHRLDIKVIAEGVETRKQHDLLKSWGCDYGQGYLYSKPVPPEQFEKLNLCKILETDHV